MIRTGGDTLRMHAPVVFQESATGRKLVDGRFSIQDSRIGFEIGAYDRARPLIIDPVVTYSTYLGGPVGETSVGVGVDAAGNMYTAGPGRVVKLSADGQTLLYSATLGDMQLFGLVADAAGNAYVVSKCLYDYPRFRLLLSDAEVTHLGAAYGDGILRHLRHQARPHGRDPLLDVGRGHRQRRAWRHCRR